MAYTSTSDWCKRNAHLCQFTLRDDTELPDLLTHIEECSWTNGFDIGDCNTSPLAGFHPEAVRMVERRDDYYLGSRAGHFVLIFGQSEAYWVGDSYGDCVVCLANHKGDLDINVFGFKDDAEEVTPNA